MLLPGKNSDESRLTSFLVKLWTILEEERLAKVICWDRSGKSFHIMDVYGFCEEVLPRFFKHKNMASFVRQLNLYGFKKITAIDRSTQENLTDHMHFAHSFFIRDEPHLLKQIKRNYSAPRRQPHQNGGDSPNADYSSSVFKSNASAGTRAVMGAADYGGGAIRPEEISLTSSSSGVPALMASEHHQIVAENGERMTLVPEEDLQSILDELNALHIGQSTANNRVSELSRENEMLWSEMSLLRDAYDRQGQNVSKLLQFLVTLVQPSAGGASHHHAKHHHQHRFQQGPAKRFLPYLDSDDGASSSSLDGTRATNDSSNSNQSDPSLALAASLPQPNWDILACIQRDMISQAIDYSAMSALQPLEKPPPTSPLVTSDSPSPPPILTTTTVADAQGAPSTGAAQGSSLAPYSNVSNANSGSRLASVKEVQNAKNESNRMVKTEMTAQKFVSPSTPFGEYSPSTDSRFTRGMNESDDQLEVLNSEMNAASTSCDYDNSLALTPMHAQNSGSYRRVDGRDYSNVYYQKNAPPSAGHQRRAYAGERAELNGAAVMMQEEHDYDQSCASSSGANQGGRLPARSHPTKFGQRSYSNIDGGFQYKEPQYVNFEQDEYNDGYAGGDGPAESDGGRYAGQMRRANPPPQSAHHYQQHSQKPTRLVPRLMPAIEDGRQSQPRQNHQQLVPLASAVVPSRSGGAVQQFRPSTAASPRFHGETMRTGRTNSQQFHSGLPTTNNLQYPSNRLLRSQNSPLVKYILAEDEDFSAANSLLPNGLQRFDDGRNVTASPSTRALAFPRGSMVSPYLMGNTSTPRKRMRNDTFSPSIANVPTTNSAARQSGRNFGGAATQPAATTTVVERKNSTESGPSESGTTREKTTSNNNRPQFNNNNNLAAMNQTAGGANFDRGNCGEYEEEEDLIDFDAQMKNAAEQIARDSSLELAAFNEMNTRGENDDVEEEEDIIGDIGENLMLFGDFTSDDLLGSA